MPKSSVVPMQMVVHVPVDRVKIVSGPTESRIKIVETLLARGQRFAKLNPLLSTGASEALFRRELKVSSITPEYGNRSSGRYWFVGMFGGYIVSGNYDIETRRGWFNLD
ncbi:MAG: hypothetical protein QG675_688 [Patescibacteria group bacterium]|nr:hypothetical protein [Patescibacteria group bacterium]